MNSLRHIFGVLCILVLPSGVLYWFLIHPFARQWRKLGPARTYLIVLPVVVALGTVAYQFREPLLGKDLGTNWILIGIALLFYVSTTWFEFQYWKQINIATLIGVTELSATGHESANLAREGIYARVRHPRYASAGLGLIGNVLLINYLGLYIVFLLLIVLGIGLLALEERELVDRFGEAYRQYQREVPRFIPRLRRRL
ncbi:MAG: isoprenylcysteine carboxylmethyltransferase family protein [Acidobacteriota bacterium]|nr:isoprenylcysteine carboxylmethyltransferase family protein [Acidobacteriota bacterium]